MYMCMHTNHACKPIYADSYMLQLYSLACLHARRAVFDLPAAGCMDSPCRAKGTVHVRTRKLQGGKTIPSELQMTLNTCMLYVRIRMDCWTAGRLDGWTAVTIEKTQTVRVLAYIHGRWLASSGVGHTCTACNSPKYTTHASMQ